MAVDDDDVRLGHRYGAPFGTASRWAFSASMRLVSSSTTATRPRRLRVAVTPGGGCCDGGIALRAGLDDGLLESPDGDRAEHHQGDEPGLDTEVEKASHG
jgi:hypothetical protein